MAIKTPLFHDSVGALQKRLRLTGINPDEDVQAVVELAMEEARNAFFKRLGGSQVAYLKAIASTDNPTTDTQYLRSIAETTEVDLTNLNLLGRLTILHKEASGQSLDDWNDNRFNADRSGSWEQNERDYLESKIEANMIVLEGKTEIEEDIPASVIGPETFITVGWSLQP